MTRPNRPHFHVWITSRSNPRMKYSWARGFPTRQAARDYALNGSKRTGRPPLDPERFEIAKCERPECAPPLD